VVATARFDGTDGSGAAPDTEKFDGSASHSNDPEATVTCAWDFGDGASAQGCRVTHTFEQSGDFTVSLTVTDSNDGTAAETLTVHVSAPLPDHSLRWARSSGGGGVGTDFSGLIAETGGGTLERIDPTDGHMVWQRSYGDPENGEPFQFLGPVFVEPGDGSIFSNASKGDPPYHSDFVRPYSAADGTPGEAFASESLEYGALDSLSMGGGGEVAVLDFTTHGDSVVVRRTDGSTWTAVMDQRALDEGRRFLIDRVSAEPGGDALVALRTLASYTYDGQTFAAGQHLLLRIHDDGHLVWWRPLPGEARALSTSAAGTVVLILQAPASFTWAGHPVPSGFFLATVEADARDRWVRALPTGAIDLAVLPAGQAAVIANLPDCGGPEVLRYNLAGDLLWSQAYPDAGCDARFTGVGILPDDVLVSGMAQATVDFGTHALPAGGFLLDLQGH
jgi:PKD repeat protein